MSDGHTDPKPTGHVPDEWSIDPESRQLRLRNSYVPPLSPGWMKRNFSLGNVLTIVSMLAACIVFTLTWARTSEMTGVRIASQVTDIDVRMQRVEAQTMSRETIAAKLDALSAQLASINQRLDRIEQRR